MNNNRSNFLIVALLVAFGTYVYFFPPTGDEVLKNEICNDFSGSNPSTLSRGLVKKMIEQYHNNQLKAINSNCDVSDDSHSIWFDLDTIKKFIYHIERNVKKNSTTTNKLGLRIYYAAYTDKSTWGTPGYEELNDLLGIPITEQYEKHHTLVILPTILNHDNVDADFNPLDMATYQGYNKMKRDKENQTFNSNYKTMTLSPFSVISSSSDPLMARNHGCLIPPATGLGVDF